MKGSVHREMLPSLLGGIPPQASEGDKVVTVGYVDSICPEHGVLADLTMEAAGPLPAEAIWLGESA